MTNAEKFKTARERIAKFYKVCCPCEKVECDRYYALECFNAWLDDEAEEEKPLPCPFCGGECVTSNAVGGMWRVYCERELSCCYSSGSYVEEQSAIAAHNRMARAVMDAGKDGEN